MIYTVHRKGEIIVEEQKKARGQIHFRITPDEAAIIEQKAAEAGLSPTMYAKKQTLEGKVKAPVITKDIGQLILPEISKIGSNLNQIARKLNMGGSVLPSEFREVQAEFETLWAYVLEGKKPKKQEEESKQTEMKEEKQEQPQAEFFSSSPSAVHTCSKCGEVLKFKHSDKQSKDYWICPNYSKDDKGHAFEWVE